MVTGCGDVIIEWGGDGVWECGVGVCGVVMVWVRTGVVMGCGNVERGCGGDVECRDRV